MASKIIVNKLVAALYKADTDKRIIDPSIAHELQKIAIEVMAAAEPLRTNLSENDELKDEIDRIVNANPDNVASLARQCALLISAALEKYPMTAQIVADHENQIATLIEDIGAGRTELEISLEMVSNIWKENGSKDVTLWEGTFLYHNGMATESNLRDDELIFFFLRHPSNKTSYEKIAAADAEKQSDISVRLEREPNRDLRMADFNRAGMYGSKQELCHNKHKEMKALLRQWCVSNKLDGVVKLNGSAYEVAVCAPKSVLRRVHESNDNIIGPSRQQ